MNFPHQSRNFVPEPRLWDAQPLTLYVGCLLFILVVWRLCHFRSEFDPHEPPVLKPKVPLVGHVWGLFKHAHGYLESLHRESGLPICTLPLFNKKIYVINSPGLVSAAFSNKNLSFGPFVIDFVKRMDELTPTARRAYTEEGMHPRLMKIFSTYMTGKHLKSMNSVQLKEIFLHLPESGPGLEVENLWIWLRDMLTLGKTTMLLGARNNPWKLDRSLITTYWKYEADPSRRLSLTEVGNRSAAKNHASLLAALKGYFDAGHDMSSDPQDADVAQMTRETGSMQRKAGFSATDIAAAHVVIIHGGLVSAVPTVFWAVMYVFSSPETLARARGEALAAVTTTNTDRCAGRREVLVPSDRLESLCPFLVSVLRETQRLVAVGTLHRRVLEDTELSDRAGKDGHTYLLKKGTAVFLPVFPCHRSSEVWGDEPNEFRAGRFQKDDVREQEPPSSFPPIPEESATSPTNLWKKAYFPFGGGRDLCPGRYLAAAETLSTLLVLTLGFDIKAVDGTTLKLPAFAMPKMTSQTARPHEGADLRATIRRRAGWEEVVWGVSTD